MDGTKVGGRSVRVSMAKSSQSVPGSISARSGHPILPQLPYDPAFAAAITAYSAALQPSSLLQAEAQARLLQLPAFNAQLNASNIQLRNNVRPKKPHHDPGKVQRTVYVESVAGSVDEQVFAPHCCVCRVPRHSAEHIQSIMRNAQQQILSAARTRQLFCAAVFGCTYLAGRSFPIHSLLFRQLLQ